MTPSLHAPTTPSEYDDNEIVNLASNPHMNDLLAARLSRRPEAAESVMELSVVTSE